MSKTMPIVKYFNIKIDKMPLIYKAGDQVNGLCFIVVDGILQLNNLDINLICEGCVDYKENKFDKKMMSSLIEKYDLMKRAGTDQTIKGEIEIDFHFTIPVKGYPSSFTGKFGFIRYKIEAVIHKDWDSFRKAIVFAVISPYNGFSPSAEIFLPIIRSTQKRVGFNCDFIELYAKIDKGWYTPGDKVSVYCNVNNNTEHKLKLKLTLYNRQDYFFTKLKSRISNEESSDFVEPQEKSYSKRILFSIPSNLKTMSFESKLLEISYEIRVTIEILELKNSLKVELPVVITFSPKTTSDSNQAQYLSLSEPQLPPSYSDCQIFQRFASEDIYFPSTSGDGTEGDSSDEKSPIYVDMPPSYAEAVFGFTSPQIDN